MDLINAKEMTGLAPLVFHVILINCKPKRDITSKTVELPGSSEEDAVVCRRRPGDWVAPKRSRTGDLTELTSNPPAK